jgi:hypothetical protein
MLLIYPTVATYDPKISAAAVAAVLLRDAIGDRGGRIRGREGRKRTDVRTVVEPINLDLPVAAQMQLMTGGFTQILVDRLKRSRKDT